MLVSAVVRRRSWGVGQETQQLHRPDHAADLSRAWRIGAGAEPSRRVATAPGSGAGGASWPKTASRSLRWPEPRPPRGLVPGAIERTYRKPLLAGPGPGPARCGPARQGGTAPLEGCGVIPAASGNRSPPRRRIHGVGSVRAAAAGTADAPLGTAAAPGPAPAWAGVRTNQRQRPASGRRDRMMGGTRHANESRHKACGNIGRWNSSSRFFSDLCASLDDSCSVAW